jgi:hypothetical protein
MGNPCADFGRYRQFVIGTLPQLRKLDGTAVTPSERILAKQELPAIHERLLKELRSEGVDVEEAMKVSDARDLAPNEEDIADIMEMPEESRPWCAATRVAEQRVRGREGRGWPRRRLSSFIFSRLVFSFLTCALRAHLFPPASSALFTHTQPHRTAKPPGWHELTPTVFHVATLRWRRRRSKRRTRR